MPDADKRKRRNRHRPEDPIQALVNRALQSPQAARVLGALEGLIDHAGNAIDPANAPLPPPTQQPQQSLPRRRANKILIARTVLHFSPTEKLSKTKITKRRRALAGLCHPDKGGSVEAMTKINQAADVLFKLV